MATEFRGLVLGLSKREVSAAMETAGLPGLVQPFSPLMTLAFGISRQALLEHVDTPPRPFRYDLPLLLGLWAVTASVFFAAAASILQRAPLGRQVPLITAATALGVTSLVLSALIARRPKHPALKADEYFGELALAPMWGSEVGIPFVLLALLVIFVLFIVWMPALLLILAPLSLGGMWKTYRACLLRANADPRLSLVGRNLLGRGAVLSRSWEPHLDAEDAQRATSLRRQHVRAHQTFNGLGLSTLAFGIVAVLAFTFDWSGWIFVLALSAVVCSASFFLLALNAWRLSRLRRSGPSGRT